AAAQQLGGVHRGGGGVAAHQVLERGGLPLERLGEGGAGQSLQQGERAADGGGSLRLESGGPGAAGLRGAVRGVERVQQGLGLRGVGAGQRRLPAGPGAGSIGGGVGGARGERRIDDVRVGLLEVDVGRDQGGE